MSDGPVRVFISYARKDRRYLGGFREHISDLVHNKILDVFDDTMIRGGSKWSSELEARLNSAEIFVILMSAKSNASKFCKRELDIAVSRRQKILPVNLGSVFLVDSNPLKPIEYVPNGGPISELPAEAQAPAWKRVVKELWLIATDLRSMAPPDPADQLGSVISIEDRRKQPPVSRSKSTQFSTPAKPSSMPTSVMVQRDLINVLLKARFDRSDWQGLALSTRALRIALDRPYTESSLPPRALQIIEEFRQTLNSALGGRLRAHAVQQSVEHCELLRRWLLDILTER